MPDVSHQVQTVLGPVDAVALGRTLMHEHVFVLTADVQRNYPREWGDEDARVADAVLSHDTCCYIDWFAPGSLDDLKQWHYLHVSQDVLPYLRAHGVTDDEIDTMLIRNPGRILSGAIQT